MPLAEKSKKRCVEIEKKIGAAGCCCMDQSYFRFLFRLARKSKQSGLSKSEKSLAKRNVTLIDVQTRLKLLNGQAEASLLILLSRETLISKPIPN